MNIEKLCISQMKNKPIFFKGTSDEPNLKNHLTTSFKLVPFLSELLFQHYNLKHLDLTLRWMEGKHAYISITHKTGL